MSDQIVPLPEDHRERRKREARERARREQPFWPPWMIAQIVTGALSWAIISMGLGVATTPMPISAQEVVVLPLELSLVIIALAGLVAGAVAGLGQWLAVRAYLERSGWWVLAATLAWGLTAVLGPGLTVTNVSFLRALPVVPAFALFGAVAGVLASVLQSVWMLQEQGEGDWRWMLGQALGMGLGWGVAQALLYFTGGNLIARLLLGGMLNGTVAGLVGGLFLRKVLRR